MAEQFVRVNVEGLDHLVRDLRTADKTLVRDFNRERRNILRKVLPEFRAAWSRYSTRIASGLTVSLEKGGMKIVTGSRGKRRQYAHSSFVEYGVPAYGRAGNYPMSSTARRVAAKVAAEVEEVVSRWAAKVGMR